jgi:uncharacterized membrane protein
MAILEYSCAQTPEIRSFPAFVLWLFISNVIQLMLMLLILVGQNLQGRHSEACAKSDFYVNVKAENEIEIILLHLENQNQLILKILRHLEERENSELKNSELT